MITQYKEYNSKVYGQMSTTKIFANDEKQIISSIIGDKIDSIISNEHDIQASLTNLQNKFQEYNNKISNIGEWKNINDNCKSNVEEFFKKFDINTKTRKETKLFNELLSHIDDSYNARNKGFVVGGYFVKQVASSNPLFNKRFIVLDVNGNITEIKIDTSIVKNKDNTNDNGKGLQDFKDAIQKAAEKKLTPTTFQSKHPNNNQGQGRF